MVVVLDDKMNFTGSVWEEEYSSLSGEKLSVKGYNDSDHISFVKKYPCLYAYDEQAIFDSSNPGHEVIYDGYWDESTGTWSGEWEVEGQTVLKGLEGSATEVFIGVFEMKMEE